jgi:predicted O-methyltransferase YrrM
MENLINYDYIKNYISDLTPETSTFMQTLEIFAYYNHVPIITKDTRRFLEVFLRIAKPEKILEVGTAIGYSAITFANILKDARITTIEIEEEMFDLAYKNVNKAGYGDRINIIFDDARNILPYLETTYDFIFMDAAKGQYTEYYEPAKKLLKSGGILVSDNILFKGMVANDELVPRNKRAIVNDLNDFNKALSEDEDFITTFIPIGDGIAISLKK